MVYCVLFYFRNNYNMRNYSRDYKGKKMIDMAFGIILALLIGGTVLGIIITITKG